jgi:predicted Zn-dependent protease
MAEELVAQKKAPLPESSPAAVLFEGRAAGQVLKRLLADQLSGTPPPKTAGESSRRAAASELADKLGQKVVAPFLSAYDDPKQRTWPGKDYLLGSYDADDEGVPAQKVAVVEAGVLKALLMSRTPSKDIARSNGHGQNTRLGSARGRVGNLFVTAKGGLARKDLLARLQKETKDGKTTPVVVRLLEDVASGGPVDLEDFGSMISIGGRSGGAPPLVPVVAYRLKDGKEEPLRGFSLEGFLPRSLKDIVAAGKDVTAVNYVDTAGGGSYGSIVTPSLLFTNVELRKQTGRNRKPPLYPHPSFANQ